MGFSSVGQIWFLHWSGRVVCCRLATSSFSPCSRFVGGVGCSRWATFRLLTTHRKSRDPEPAKNRLGCKILKTNENLFLKCRIFLHFTPIIRIILRICRLGSTTTLLLRVQNGPFSPSSYISRMGGRAFFVSTHGNWVLKNAKIQLPSMDTLPNLSPKYCDTTTRGAWTS